MKKTFLFLGLFLLLSTVSYSQTPTFSAVTSTVAPANVTLHGDVNNDGFEDLITLTNNAINVLISNGDGTYRAPITYPVANAGTFPAVLGDFNNDGKLDLVVQNSNADANGNTAYLMYMGNGDGTFATPVSHGVTGQLERIQTADVNHDGKSDLLLDVTTDGGTTYDVRVLFGNGDGTFSAGPTTYNTNAGSGILVGDFNGDGKVDIAATNGSEGYSYLGILVGDGTGKFTPTYSDTTSFNVLYVAGDVNGDGITDVVGTAYIYSTSAVMQQRYLYAYYGNYSGTMTPAQIPTQNCGTGYVSIADFNGDGIPDIAMTETGCDSSTVSTADVAILSGKGNNQFATETPVYTASDYTYSLTALRADHDTRPDLVIAHSATNTGNPNLLTTLFNTTSGNFPTCNAPDAATGIALCTPQSGSTVSSPVKFAFGAASPIEFRKTEVWVDGNKVAEQFKGVYSHYAFMDASVSLAAGSHNVTIFAVGVDNSLQSKSFTLNVASSSNTSPCSAPSTPGVHVCSPANGSSVASPVAVQATSTVTGTIARMEVWVDGVKKCTSTSTSLNTSIPLSAGSHRFDFYAVNTAGQKWETTTVATSQVSGFAVIARASTK